ERGRLVAVAASGGTPEAVAPDLPEGWPTGMSFVGDRGAFGLELGGEYRIYAGTTTRPDRLLATFGHPAGVGRAWPYGTGGLSADGSLLCLHHAEHGDILHNALRLLDASTGEPRGELVDPGRNLDPCVWSPLPGDQRLAFTSELGPFERPAIWDAATGERRDVDVDLPGAVFPLDWWPDGAALLVLHEHLGVGQLYRLDPRTGDVTLVADPGGDVDDARVRPDGEVWLRASDSVRPPRILAADGREVLPNPDEPPPEGRPYRSFFTTGPGGQPIQSFVVTPDGEPPFPTVISIHGGPEWHERDRFDAETQAFVDEGYAVALVNYRGSTGYGVAFRESLIGNVCHTESEDIVATLDALVDEGTTDPELVFWSGWSWGGCLACFNAGMHPERWRALFAGIPAGDFVAAHRAAADELQAWDDAVYGGGPDDVPEAYRRSDPMTYADRVTAPTLIIAGEQDPRCPPEGITPWVDAVRARGVPVDVEMYAAGHHANSMEQQVDHMRRILAFFARYR
ncbi:MAG TPA: prolyl oligopeptidase family serine peptidase, partial [Actinomycetota bacterium]